eukprot:15359971-Ditylum_brightwellii.AAC.1
MTAVEWIYTQLPLDLQIIQPLYEYFAGDSKLKMKQRVVAADIAVEKTKKLRNELIEEFRILPEQAKQAEQPKRKKKKRKNTHDEGKERNKETEHSGNEDNSSHNDAFTTCGINTSVANNINDDTPPNDLPSEYDL